ncbi:hypothetical protein NE237_024969 [Protea cynaroides]|uniref:3-hydroxyacyl-CoA dehydrogenase n=1 Tax=Protea cynaroides TaxID=273540 RepID=A0A9Q0K1A9_9MAGN|nr:hypothetical protein NE237_024969 [Protea cynaroides]
MPPIVVGLGIISPGIQIVSGEDQNSSTEKDRKKHITRGLKGLPTIISGQRDTFIRLRQICRVETMANMRLKVEVGSDGVAVMTICNPPVNAVAPPIILDLKEKYREVMKRDDVKAIVVTGEGGRFSGGFDISVFEAIHKDGDISRLPDASVDLLVNTIEDAKKPTVAAIEGLALGGGLELAMGCHARIAAPKVQLGLPELTLGVIPGFGGTQRLPRLVGVSKGVEMILFSKLVTSEEGKKLGLIDAVVPSEELLAASRRWALDIAEKRKPWVSSLRRTDRLGSLSEAREVIKRARQQAKQIAPNMPQHQAVLDVIEEGIVFGGYSGILKETKVFNELVLSSTSKGLVHTFFAQRATSKVPNVTDAGLKPRAIKKVAIIGGGLMGSGIATALIVSNISVVLKEINANLLQKGMKAIEANLQGLVAKRILTKEKAEKALSILNGVLDYSEFKNVDMVIEAVIESIPLKQSIFSEIEKICPPHCILATNTSTIDLNMIGEKTNSQDRIIGAHFFSPAHVMPLLEIVRTEKTSAQTILDLMTVGKIIKKVPVVVGNCIGFAVNRTFFPYTQGAHLLANLGVDVFRIDGVIRNFGMPMGPFQLQDLAGYGVALLTGEVLINAFADRSFKSPLVELLMKNGRNGKNNGKGYYIYQKGSKPEPDPSVLSIIEESRRLTNVMPGGKPITVSDQEILEMVLFPVVNEACRVLDEGVVVRASDLDIACVLGMSFPAYRGGIVFWADSIGAEYIFKSLKKWSESYGSFFKPSTYLEERARKGIKLSDPAGTYSRSQLKVETMANMRLTMEVGSDGVAVIRISNPPVNALAPPILFALKEKYAEAMKRDDVKAIVVTGEGGRFSGGFDISVFEAVHKDGDLSRLPNVSVDLLINTIEDAKKPSVAAVEGLALGGGLELALGCHARIAAPKVQLSLPELTLGVIPGLGGTQRLPRLVGVSKAVEMMLFSKSVTSEEGKKLGLIDAVVPSEELLAASRRWALDIVEMRKPWVSSLRRTDRLGSLSEAREVLKRARQQARQAAPNMPQHQRVLDVIEEGIVFGGYSGILKEIKVSNELVLSSTSKGLVHSFFAQRATSKVPNVTDAGLKPRAIKKVAIIGGGLMGSGIATAFIVSNISVFLKEINADLLQKGMKAIDENLQGLVAKRKMTKEKAEKAFSILKGVLDYSEFENVDMVIEAVIESIPLKQSIFSEIEKICPPHCILATNTSTIDLNIIGEKTNSQDRIIGAHFFSPAHVMPLLEIVRTEKTSTQAILDLMAVGKIIKKVSVVVGNCIGFAVNRTFFPYTQGAHLLANLGVDAFRIDRVISNFGMPMGPFQLQDLAGYGVSLLTGKVLTNAFSDRSFKSPLVELLMQNGRNGKNNGKGFYIYQKGSKPKPDPSVLPIIEESRRLTNVMPGGKPITVSDQEILEMVLFPVVNEACRVLDEGVVVRASDLDVACVLGMSFPAYRGGIVYWADTIGAEYIFTSLKKWSELYGSFFKPSKFLEERARKGMKLSEPAGTSSRSRM